MHARPWHNSLNLNLCAIASDLAIPAMTSAEGHRVAILTSITAFNTTES
jgi:hypothetical protein